MTLYGYSVIQPRILPGLHALKIYRKQESQRGHINESNAEDRYYFEVFLTCAVFHSLK